MFIDKQSDHQGLRRRAVKNQTSIKDRLVEIEEVPDTSHKAPANYRFGNRMATCPNPLLNASV
jgi:hypothetical protein